MFSQSVATHRCQPVPTALQAASASVAVTLVQGRRAGIEQPRPLESKPEVLVFASCRLASYLKIVTFEAATYTSSSVEVAVRLSTTPSQSLSSPSQISGWGCFIDPMHLWLPGCELSQTQVPVPAQAPLPTAQVLPIRNGSSVLPLQSLSSASQPNLVSSIGS